MNNCEKKPDLVKANRIHFLDNLRTFIIFLVVLCHAGGVYESSGGWASFWIVDDPATNDLAGILFIIMDIFMMSTIFFISGYLAPLSMDTRSSSGFLKVKFKRLMLPWIIASVTLIPLYKVIFLYSRGLGQHNWTTYFHWSNGIWSQNWLWFLPVLFAFNAIYVLLAKLDWAPRKISVKTAIVVMFVLGFVNSLGMDLLKIRGWTKTPVIDFQNERLGIYFMVFLLGTLCFQKGLFAVRPRGKKLYIVVNCLAWIPMNIYIFFLLYPWFKPGSFIVSAVADRAIVWLAFHLSLLSMLYIMIETFRRYFDRSGRIRDALNANSYYVYIIHVIVIGVIATALLDWAMPSLLKYAVVTVAAWVASNLIISACRKVVAWCIFIKTMPCNNMESALLPVAGETKSILTVEKNEASI